MSGNRSQAGLGLEALETRRLMAAMMPDPSFGTDSRYGQTGSNVIHKLVGLQPDGRPIVLRSDNSGPLIKAYTYLQRLNLDGTRDKTYNGGDPVRQTDGGRGTVELDAQGRAIWTQRYDPDPSRYNDVFYATVHRLDANGAPDAKFGKNGRMTILLPTSPRAGMRVKAYVVNDTALDANGRAHMLLSVYLFKKGQSTSNTSIKVVVRLTESGRFDPTFGDNGFAVVNIGVERVDIDGETAPRIQFDPSGRILVTGQIGEATLAAQRFTAAGVADQTYGNKSRLVTPAGSEPYISQGYDNTNDPIRYFVDPQGGIVFADFAPKYVPGGTPHVIRRVSPNGRLQADFGNGGSIDVPGVYDTISGFDAQGRLLISDGNRTVYTYTLDGDLVTSNPLARELSYLMPDRQVVDDQGRIYINSYDGTIMRLIEARPVVYEPSNGHLYIRSETTAENFEITKDGRRVTVRRNGEIVLRVSERVGRIVVGMNFAEDTMVNTSGLPLQVTENERDVIIELTTGGGFPGDRVAVERAGITLGNNGSFLVGGAFEDTTVFAGGGDHTISLSGRQGYNDALPIREQPKVTLRLTGGSYTVYTKAVNTDIVLDTALGANLNLTRGNDRVSGGSGNDTINAGMGTDYIYANAGDDTITGKSTTTGYVAGGEGNDFIRAEGGQGVVLDGGSGNDQIHVPAGRAVILGGSGNDAIFARNSAIDTINGGKGRDTVTGDSDDILTAIERVL